MNYGWKTIGLHRIVAITKPENRDSIKLLEKLGLRFEKMIQMSPHAGESALFSIEKPA